MDKTIAITGHLGYIGSHLLKHLPNAIGLDIKEGNDIMTCELPEADIIIHLAAQPGVLASIEDPFKTTLVNTAGTVRLLQHYKDKKFIFASTGGAIQDEILSPYGLSKFCAEEFIKMLHPNYVILRFANVYGGVGSRSVAEKFIKGDINVFGDGTQTRTFVHIEDLIDGILKSIDWEKGSYYFGSDDNHSVKEIAELVGELMNKPVTYTDFRQGELLHSSLKNTTPNWQPKHNLIDYIKEICTTYQS